MAAIAAVAAGSSAMTTAPWLAGAVVERERGEQREADDDAAGDDGEAQPLRPAGRRWRVIDERDDGEAAATTARPEPMNSGERPSTATRVNGIVNEKAPRRAGPTRGRATGAIAQGLRSE